MRWTFRDTVTLETYTVPVNPDSMTSPFPERGTRHARGGGDDRIRTLLDSPTPVRWEFGGVIRTQAHHDALEAWAKKSVPIEVTDHLARTFRVVITSFEATERKPTPTVPWRMRYSMKTLLMEEV